MDACVTKMKGQANIAFFGDSNGTDASIKLEIPSGLNGKRKKTSVEVNMFFFSLFKLKNS